MNRSASFQFGARIVSAGLLLFPLFGQGEEPDRNDPAAELASFKLADGFQAELFASEKDGVIKPVQIRWDSLGRLWVIGTQTYPQIKPGEEPDDKVLILEDPQHTGHVQKVTTYAGGLMIPTGLEVDGDGKGCYVSEGTKLWHYRGEAPNAERSIVMRGFGTGDNHQNINSFLWSPGGELMFSQGLHGFARVETPWGISKLDQAGLWRFRPHQKQLDSFWGGSAEPQNPWGWAFTDWGQPIVVAGNNGGVFYPLPEMISGHDDRRAGNIWVNARGRKSSGPDIVGTSHLPPEWQGVLLTGGYINNAIWALKIEDDGAGFRVTDLPPLITSTHGSFRPVDIKIGPDGAIYVADWYNPIIGHYQASFRHPDRDKVHGRIWRITYKGRPLVQQAPLTDASLEQLFEALKSPERWMRYQAKRVLAGRGTGVTTELRNWYQRLDPNGSGTEHALMEALGVFESREEVEPALLDRLLKAKDANARAYAAEVIGRWADRLPDRFDAESHLADLAQDENPRVRMAAIVAAANIPRPESIIVALSAAQNPRDRFIDSALHQAVIALRSQWFPLAQKSFPGWKPQWIETLVRLDASPMTADVIRQLLTSSTVIPNETRAGLALTFVDTAKPEDLRWFLDPANFTAGGTYDTALHARVLAKLNHTEAWSKVTLTPQDQPALDSLIEAKDAGVRAQAIRLVGLWHLLEKRPKLVEIASAPGGNLSLRTAAIDSLGLLGLSRDQDFLEDLARNPLPAETAADAAVIQASAVQALARSDLSDAAAVAAKLLSKSQDFEQNSRIFQAFFERKGGADALASAMVRASLPAKTATELLQIMRSRGLHNGPMEQALKDSEGQQTTGLKATPEVIAKLTRQIHENSDAKRGDAVFHRPDVGCTACHSVGGQGGIIGPPLDTIGSGQPLDFIIGAVLEPQKEVKESYEAVEVTTKDGQITQGYRAHEDASELTLRDIAQQLKEVRISKERIAQTREIGSLMPMGLVDRLSRQELCDLFRYLSELGKPVAR